MLRRDHYITISRVTDENSFYGELQGFATTHLVTSVGGHKEPESRKQQNHYVASSFRGPPTL